MDASFLSNLLHKLRNNFRIGYTRPTIPYVIGAFKIYTDDSIPVTETFIKEFLSFVIDSDIECKYWIRTCANIDQLVISIIDEERDSDIIKGRNYRSLKNSKGIPTIFFEDAFMSQIYNLTIDNVASELWSQYKDSCFIPRKYSRKNKTWEYYSDEEISFIKNI